MRPCHECVLSVCDVFQSVLGAEGLSLAFRHIVSSLLWYCSQHSSEELLHEVIICVGYFTVNNTDNQVSPVPRPRSLQSNAALQFPFLQSSCESIAGFGCRGFMSFFRKFLLFSGSFCFLDRIMAQKASIQSLIPRHLCLCVCMCVLSIVTV